ncbi:MAG: hypothetical protein ABIV25_11535 [Paracoccaceae bacterium]
MTGRDRRVIEGFRLPQDFPVTPNELHWVELLRAIMGEADLAPTVVSVQALRRAMRKEGLTRGQRLGRAER